MNNIIYPEDVDNTIQKFFLANDGDVDTLDLILSIGADLLDISPDSMYFRVTSSY